VGSNPTSSSSLTFGWGFFVLGDTYCMNEEVPKKKKTPAIFTAELQESMFSFFQTVIIKLTELESRLETLEKEKNE
jgi:hypothetical protein